MCSFQLFQYFLFVWKDKWIAKIRFLFYKFKLGNIVINAAMYIEKTIFAKKLCKNDLNDSKKNY